MTGSWISLVRRSKAEPEVLSQLVATLTAHLNYLGSFKKVSKGECACVCVCVYLYVCVCDPTTLK